MRFLANENIPDAVIDALRDQGHDVACVKVSLPGAEDRVVLALAQAEQRVVLTLDTDFGELAFRSQLPAECGVVLVRLDWNNPTDDNDAIVRALTSRESWTSTFAVIERDRVRLRPLPLTNPSTAE
jgi:predicted nuclease of predicted toxin-antitoxin system